LTVSLSESFDAGLESLVRSQEAMKTIAPLLVAGFALGACNAPAPQASAPPTPGRLR
jgi:hypothetical protein